MIIGDEKGELKAAEEQFQAAREKLLAVRRGQPPLKIKDYVLTTTHGKPVMLSDLFAGKDELMVIHNMGRGCAYCTLWADGFNGVWQHLANRVPFAVVTPDSAEKVKEFSMGRGWTFPIYSSHGTSFFPDLGFANEKGSPYPGVSTFKRNSDGSIVRTCFDYFGPGDQYCSVWHLMDLLPKGINEWEPKYKY